MKKIITLVLFIIPLVTINAQEINNSASFNIGYSTNNFFKMGVKYWHNNLVLGFDGGVNCNSPFKGKDYTEIIGILTYPDDVYEKVSYESLSLNVMIGHIIDNNFYMGVLVGGYRNENGYNSYDNHQILSSNGYYSFRTNETWGFNTGILLGYKNKKIDLSIGYMKIEKVFITIGIPFVL